MKQENKHKNLSLYYNKYCYFCQKVLMALRGHQHPIQLLSTSERTNQAALVKGGGKGQVPCLRIESPSGSIKWLYESDDILSYIQKEGLLI